MQNDVLQVGRGFFTCFVAIFTRNKLFAEDNDN